MSKNHLARYMREDLGWENNLTPKIEWVIWETKDKIFNSLHHLIWQENKDWANVELPINKVPVKQKWHDAFNVVFHQEKYQDPQSQLLYILSVWLPTIDTVIAKRLADILCIPRNQFYKKELLKKKSW